MKAYWERIYNGVVKENPAFILMLGMCPTLAVTTSATNGLGMGLSSLVVLPVAAEGQPPYCLCEIRKGQASAVHLRRFHQQYAFSSVGPNR